jgi:hypothetical protein
VLTSEFFGAHVVPPGNLAYLRVGMKVADAKKLAPGPVDVRAGVPTGVDGVREFVAIDDKSSTVRAIYLNLPGHAEDLIAEAWGIGMAAMEPVKKNVLVWPDPSTGWRATLRPALGSSQDLAFDQYLPVTQLFGEQPDVLDGVPVLGLTVDEVKKMFEGQVVASRGDLTLTLLPTEWERTATKFNLDVHNGRIREIVFLIPFKARPEARDALLELFTLGQPRSRRRWQGVLNPMAVDAAARASEDDKPDAWRAISFRGRSVPLSVDGTWWGARGLPERDDQGAARRVTTVPLSMSSTGEGSSRPAVALTRSRELRVPRGLTTLARCVVDLAGERLKPR